MTDRSSLTLPLCVLGAGAVHGLCVAALLPVLVTLPAPAPAPTPASHAVTPTIIDVEVVSQRAGAQMAEAKAVGKPSSPDHEPTASTESSAPQGEAADGDATLATASLPGEQSASQQESPPAVQAQQPASPTSSPAPGAAASTAGLPPSAEPAKTGSGTSEVPGAAESPRALESGEAAANAETVAPQPEVPPVESAAAPQALAEAPPPVTLEPAPAAPSAAPAEPETATAEAVAAPAEPEAAPTELQAAPAEAVAAPAEAEAAPTEPEATAAERRVTTGEASQAPIATAAIDKAPAKDMESTHSRAFEPEAAPVPIVQAAPPEPVEPKASEASKASTEVARAEPATAVPPSAAKPQSGARHVRPPVTEARPAKTPAAALQVKKRTAAPATRSVVHVRRGSQATAQAAQAQQNGGGFFGFLAGPNQTNAAASRRTPVRH